MLLIVEAQRTKCGLKVMARDKVWMKMIRRSSVIIARLEAFYTTLSAVCALKRDWLSTVHQSRAFFSEVKRSRSLNHSTVRKKYDVRCVWSSNVYWSLLNGLRCQCTNTDWKPCAVPWCLCVSVEHGYEMWISLTKLNLLNRLHQRRKYILFYELFNAFSELS